MRRFLKNKLSVIGMVVIIAFILIAIFADQLAPYDYAAQDLPSMYLSPCAEHPLGTDNLGRDMLSRIIYGTRISLLIGFSSVGISLLIGTLLGCLAGFYGGKADTIIMRFMDVMLAVPSVLLAIVIAAVLGTGVFNLILAIGIASIPSYARIVRASILSIRDQEYIEAVSYTHLRAHETGRNLVCRLLLEKKNSYTHLRAHETRHDLVCRLLLEKQNK